MHPPKQTVVTLTIYEQVVQQLRDHGAMTSVQVAKRLGWSSSKAGSGICRGRELGLILPPPDSNRRRRVYTAAQVPGWPLPAPDTIARPLRDYPETSPPPNLSNLT